MKVTATYDGEELTITATDRLWNQSQRSVTVTVGPPDLGAIQQRPLSDSILEQVRATLAVAGRALVDQVKP